MLSVFAGASVNDRAEEYKTALASVSDNAALLMVDCFPAWNGESGEPLPWE